MLLPRRYYRMVYVSIGLLQQAIISGYADHGQMTTLAWRV
jgi:hypothetical protein